MIYKELLTAAREEAKNLQKTATRAEKDKLVYEDLHGESPWSCIYGQMTGNCYSDRARELITECAVPIAKSGRKGMERITALDGYPKKFDNNLERSTKRSYYTALENLLYQNTDPEDIRGLVEFIKS